MLIQLERRMNVCVVFGTVFWSRSLRRAITPASKRRGGMEENRTAQKLIDRIMFNNLLKSPTNQNLSRMRLNDSNLQHQHHRVTELTGGIGISKQETKQIQLCSFRYEVGRLAIESDRITAFEQLC